MMNVNHPIHPIQHLLDHQSIQDRLVHYNDLYWVRKDEDTRFHCDETVCDKKTCKYWITDRKQMVNNVMELAVKNKYSRQITHTCIGFMDLHHIFQHKTGQFEANWKLITFSSLSTAVKMNHNYANTYASHLFAHSDSINEQKERNEKLTKEYEISLIEIVNYEGIIIRSLNNRLNVYTSFWWYQQIVYHSLYHLNQQNNRNEEETDRKIRIWMISCLVDKVYFLKAAQFLDWIIIHHSYTFREIAALVFCVIYLSTTSQSLIMEQLLLNIVSTVTNCNLQWVKSHSLQLQFEMSLVQWSEPILESLKDDAKHSDMNEFQHDFHKQTSCMIML